MQSFTVGFVTGVVIHGAGKAIRSIRRCFVAGTGVLMASGAVKAIENVRIGDLVKSFDPIKGKALNKRVLQKFTSETSETVTINTSDGQRVTATPGHQFYANSNWISVEDLKAGDILVNVNGQKVVVEKVQHEILETPVKVYNFEVADNHNYFVSESINSDATTFILVHNQCSPKLNGKNIDEYTKGFDKVISGNADAPYSQAPNSVYLKKNNGEITNIAYYEDHGLQWRRVDIKGKTHPCKDLNCESVIPHEHFYKISNPSEGVYYRNKTKDVYSISDEIVDELIKFFSKR